ncbi:nucleotidyltransferase [bacterium SCSIO 12643]|nr:nucleotidyltransferase [bacterium SCSIO 12643]
MNIIVPMAGMGKRMRPHTLTTPKPLLPIAGKSIVQRLVENLAEISDEPIERIGFVTGRFGKETEESLLEIAKAAGAEGSIHYQDEALGTAHAIMCAQEVLEGKTIVAFADTLFKADFQIDHDADGVLWVQQIDDPSAFGVVKLNDEGVITDYVEKPIEFVSDLAMIGIYYFKDGNALKTELQYLLDNNIIKGGEYQLPDALRNMTEKGVKFVPGKVDEWLDCGNKNATVYTNTRILAFDHEKGENLVHASAKVTDSVIIEPCYIGEGVEISNSVIGPGVSISDNTKISGSVIDNSIVYSNTVIRNKTIGNSMIGHFVKLEDQVEDLNIGDYSA